MFSFLEAGMLHLPTYNLDLKLFFEPQAASTAKLAVNKTADFENVLNFMRKLLLFFLFYPLSEPAIIPLSKYFWKNGYITINGKLEMTIVAYLINSAKRFISFIAACAPIMS